MDADPQQQLYEEMDCLWEQVPKAPSRAQRVRRGEFALDGPWERRITRNRRLSLKTLLPSFADQLSVRSTWCGLILSTDITAGPLITIKEFRGHREVWLRGSIRKLLPGALDPAAKGSSSTPVDVYRRYSPDFGGIWELEVLPRGQRRAI
ncbi:hypothetical protein [Ferrimicrobium acidiphilum]|uniref:Uncharacterized protein n=1 Tax=Ferrimicrobium acidiphilum DSM 19497 TaxID=1121877 RepID=A0A0D8FSL8_9ACTN|nr:hypothetical protein [Ferrimicrobium acidiphilum]KJE76268.1 hypothetical protein FEAC_20030 [Ferrimicrobium acidiphilum DSM 19497]